jgi:hypothetical protein
VASIEAPSTDTVGARFSSIESTSRPSERGEEHTAPPLEILGPDRTLRKLHRNQPLQVSEPSRSDISLCSDRLMRTRLWPVSLRRR